MSNSTTYKERVGELESAVRRLRNMATAQASRVNLGYDAYSHGLANGLILALSMFNDSNPRFIAYPSSFQASDEEQEK